MRLIDKIHVGPFASAYHSALVNSEFLASLSAFLDAGLLPQVDHVIEDAEGSLTATFDDDRHCGPNSLVKDIFTLEMSIFGESEASEVKCDIVFDIFDKTFSPRTGHAHNFYVWTPARRLADRDEKESIQRLVDDFRRDHTLLLRCPLCDGSVRGIDDPATLDVRCTERQCFKYSYRKDDNGRLLHGHFFTKHPLRRP